MEKMAVNTNEQASPWSAGEAICIEVVRYLFIFIGSEEKADVERKAEGKVRRGHDGRARVQRR